MESERQFGSNASQIPVISYNDGAFERAAAQLSVLYDEGASVRVVFAGGSRDAHQRALTTLAEHTVENVHQFALSALLKERRMQTQSSVRKAFDAAAEEGALLFFEDVDTLFSWHHPDTRGGGEEPSAVEYFLQRVEAYDGVVALAMSAPEHVEAARPYGIDLVVEFD